MKNGTPKAVSEKLDALCVEGRSPAYLCLGPDGHVLNQGGHCDHYGFTDLNTSLPANTQLDYLEGLFPLDDTPPELPPDSSHP